MVNKYNSKDNKQSDKKTLFKVVETIELMGFLQKKYPDKSRNKIKSILSHRQISVDCSVITQYNHKLKPGQEVEINWGLINQVVEYKGLDILYEDDFIIIIEKKSGLLSMATDKEKEKTAFSILSAHVKKENPQNKIFIIHRLDRDASGVMLFAKNFEIQQTMQRAWKEAVLERIYTVVVEGKVDKENGTITSYLKENQAFVMYSSKTDNGGQKAITHYQILKSNNDYSLLEVRLQTGRKNQIRVHMQDIGHSIIGDKKYGAIVNPIGRLGLHARLLSFIHPVSAKEIRFESEIPNKFIKLFE